MTEWASRFSLLLLRQRLTTNGSHHTQFFFTSHSPSTTIITLSSIKQAGFIVFVAFRKLIQVSFGYKLAQTAHKQ